MSSVASYVLLEGVSWRTYQSLADEVGERPIKFTFDRGQLEITTAEFEHEVYKSLLGRLVGLLVVILHIPMQSGGSTTMRLESKKKAMEPDECFWIEHERHMRGKREFDLRHDPPPDLVIEVDDLRCCVDRLPILAAFGVPEVWHFKDYKLRGMLLQESGKYKQALRSRSFPFLAIAELQPFVDRSHSSQTKVARDFMDWVETQLKPRRNGGRKNGKGGST